MLVVLGPVLVLLPLMPVPVEPVVCAPAQANAPSRIGAANHVRLMLVSSKNNIPDVGRYTCYLDSADNSLRCLQSSAAYALTSARVAGEKNSDESLEKEC